METKTFIGIIIAFLLAACHADPGIISDDDTMPATTNDSLICDTLPAPNQVFSNAIGEVLVMSDSFNMETDTLICTENYAIEMEAIFNNNLYCQSQYTAAYQTHWLPFPDDFSIIFKDYVLPNSSLQTAYSLGLDDFEASNLLTSVVTGVYEDSLLINGIMFHNIFQYQCKSNATCTFVEKFVFSQNSGLVAMKRNGKWWTKI